VTDHAAVKGDQREIWPCLSYC